MMMAYLLLKAQLIVRCDPPSAILSPLNVGASTMADTNPPTLFSQLWAQVESTLLGKYASEAERIQARTAFLSGANAVFVLIDTAKVRGGSQAVTEALQDLRADLKREAGSR
jgi:hypothetical protein